MTQYAIECYIVANLCSIQFQKCTRDLIKRILPFYVVHALENHNESFLNQK